jgi:Glycosyltransferase family 87
VAVSDPQASAAPVDSEPATQIRLARPVRPEIRPYIVLGLISLAVSLYLTWHLLGDLPNRMVAGNPADIRLFTWYLEHDVQSVLHGHDPLFFTTMNAPAGVNAMWNTSLLLPALIMTPVTLLAGPLASYNVLFVLALATGPLCAFPLLRRFTDSVPAAGLGALVFGFSPAVLASGIGHINLVLTGLMPVTLLLADDLATGRRDPWPAGAALGLAMAAQLFTSEELLFQTGLVLLVAGVLILVTQPRAVTATALGRIGRGAATAAGVFIFVSAGALWLQFLGPLHQYGSPFTLGYYETDVRGLYVPSHMLWLTTRGSSAFAASYVPGAPEYLAYLGIPLLVAAPIVGLTRIGDLRTRLLLGVGAVFALFSLGGTLLDNGRNTAISLPWGAVEGWPVFGSALPDRFAIVVALAAAGLLAVGVGWLLGTGRAAARVLAVLLAAACAVPLLARPYPAAAADPVPPFFPAVSRWLAPGSTVLVLPYPTDTQTVPLVWQAAAHMEFQMPGGYFIGPASGGHAYVSGPGPTAVASTLIGIQLGRPAPPVTPALRASFWRDMSYWGARAIVAGPTARTALARFITQLVRRPPLRTGGVLLWRQPAGR